jgi:hypothetical protein
MAADGWRRKFEPPIVTPEGTTLRTLRDAIKHLAARVPATERDMPQITTAADLLTRAAEGSEAWMFFAKIAVLQALHRHRENGS